MTAIKTSVKWEAVETVGDYITTRMRMASGWLMRVDNTVYKVFQLEFVPDPEHTSILSDTDDA